jgi:hypothetical protein
MTNISIHASMMSQWGVMKLLAEYLDKRHRLSFVTTGATRPTIELAFPNARVSDAYAEAAVASKTAWSIRRIFTRTINRRRYWEFHAYFLAKIAYYRSVFESQKTDILLVSEDGISSELWLIEAARQMGIAVVVIPYGASGKEDFVNLLRQKQRDNSLIVYSDSELRLLDSINGRRWATELDGVAVGIYPIEYVLALNDNGINLPNPWTTHGGCATALAAESPGMLDHYKREGIAESKLRLTGTPYADRITSQLDAEPALRTGYERCDRITAHETSILVSLPPDYHQERGHLSPYESYPEMCRSVARHVTGIPNSRVTFVVHPAYHLQPDLLAEVGNVNISSEWVIDLIPRHDVFITCGSSTLRWAAACRKPSINIDFYKFRLEFFTRLPGLRTFEDPLPFFEYISTVVQDHEATRIVRQELRNRSTEWGVFDGNGSSNIDSLLGELAS